MKKSFTLSKSLEMKLTDLLFHLTEKEQKMKSSFDQIPGIGKKTSIIS